MQITKKTKKTAIIAGATALILGGSIATFLILRNKFHNPLRGARVSSGFGYRLDPFTGAKSFHSGIDLSAKAGTPIRAAKAGKVSMVGYDGVSGYYVKLKHDDGYDTFYCHMLKQSSVKTGQKIRRGQIIGLVGSTGRSTGPHLHFMMWKDGKLIDPKEKISVQRTLVK